MEAHNTTTVSFWQFSCMSVWVCCAMPHFHFHAHKLYLNLQLNKLDIKNWFKLFAIVLCVCKQFNVPNNANAIDANSHAYPSHSDLTFFFLALIVHSFNSIPFSSVTLFYLIELIVIKNDLELILCEKWSQTIFTDTHTISKL